MDVVGGRMKPAKAAGRMKSLAYAALVATMFFWGSNAIVGAILQDDISPAVLSVFRWLVALAIMIPVTLWVDGFPKEILKRNFKGLLLMGFTGVTFFHTLIYISLVYTSPINVVLFNAIVPAAVALLSFAVYRKKLRHVQLLGMLLSFAGVLIILTRGSMAVLLGLQFNLGDLLMLIAVIFWAVYSMVGTKVMKAVPLLSAITWSSLLGLLILLPFGAWEYSVTGKGDLADGNWLYVLYMGIGPSFLAFLGWNLGVRAIGPEVSSNFLNLTPCFAAILSIVILKDPLLPSQLWGGIITLLGVYFAANGQKPSSEFTQEQTTIEG